MILSEYPGYTDEKLLDLPLDRIKQMVSVIADRKIREQEQQHQLSLWVAQAQVQALGQIMAGLADSKKTAKSMTKSAQSVDFTINKERKKNKPMPSTALVESMMGVRPGGHVGLR